MSLNYRRLKNWKFEDISVEYSVSDAMLYALGLNIGANPLDSIELNYAAANGEHAFPTMATILGRLGPWMSDPETGIDYSRIVVGEVALSLYRPLPVSGSLIARHHIVRVHDKGVGRGALVVVARELVDEKGEAYAQFEQTTFCRADGGFSTVNGESDPLPKTTVSTRPDRPADANYSHPTLEQQALIYRLTGDLNPLHFDLETAKRVGFNRPILHGMASFGIAAWSVLRALGHANADDLSHISCRMSAPVFPGSTLKTRVWSEGKLIWFETESDGRLVLTNGRAALK